MVGPRQDYAKGTAILPNNLVLTLTGAGMLWFGWFGFNAGSAVAVEHPVAGPSAGLAFTTTQAAAAAAGLVWMAMERWHHGKVTSLGLASGIVAGLVAVTPAAGHVRPGWAMVLGAIAAVACYWAVQLKGKLKYDDSLDAFGVHGVGGMLGALLTGVFCFTPVVGVLGGQWGQLGIQAVGVAVSVAFAAGGTFVVASVVKAIMPLRCTEQEEREGLDLHVHGERGYHLDQT
jgi:Amt family ammonium transporter